MDSLIFSAVPVVGKIGGNERGNTMIAEDLYDSSAYDEKYQAEVQQLKSQNGLELSGQTYYRLDEGLGWDEEDAVSRYNAKIQVELAWSFFQSSFFQRKGKIRKLQLEKEIAKNRFEQRLLAAYTEGARDALLLRYHRSLASVLIHRIRNLELVDEAYRYLLQTERISSDELLKVVNEKTEAERTLAGLSGHLVEADHLSGPVGVVVRIDTAALVRDIGEIHSGIRDVKLRSALLDQQYQHTNYLQQASVAPFVRYSHYLRPDLKNSTNMDVGVRFKLPLSREVRRKRKAIVAEKRLLSSEIQQVEQQLLNEVRGIVIEIERLNSLSDGEVKRIRTFKQYLEERKSAYERLIGEYSLPARMREYNVYLSCWETLIEYQYRRDCLLNDLQRLLGDIPLDSYCTEIQI